MHTFKILLDDFTEHVDAAFKARYRIVRAFTVYVYDAARVVHCCELAGSRECWPVSYVIEFADYDESTERDREAAEDELYRYFADEQVTYIHARRGDGARRQTWSTCTDREWAELCEFYGDDARAMQDRIVDNIRGNISAVRLPRAARVQVFATRAQEVQAAEAVTA